MFIGSRLLIFLFYKRIHLIMHESLLNLCFITLRFMRWLIDLTYWNHISLIFPFSLSLILPLIRILFLYFAFRLRTSQLIIRLVFLSLCKKRFQLLQRYVQYIISLSWLVLWIQIMRSNELVISAIVISSYSGPWSVYLILTLKKPTSHTLSIAIISNGQSNFYSTL